MAIRAYEENGKNLYDVYIHVRSTANPKVRIQRRKTKLPSLDEARKTEADLYREAHRELPLKENTNPTWGGVIDRWERAHLEGPLYDNPVTVGEYASMARRWTPGWSSIPADGLNRGDGRKVVEYALKSGKSRGFVKNIKNTINRIFNWGIEERLIQNVSASPVYGLKVGAKEEKFPEILNLKEIQTLLLEAKRRNNGWYPIWAMALLTGMRSGELYALEWGDIDTERNLIRVRKSFNKKLGRIKSTKAGYWRNVPVSKELQKLLDELSKTRKNERFVLPHPRYWQTGMQSLPLRAFLEELGLPSVRFHTLRACFATQLIGNGVEVGKVMKIGGWRDIKTMQTYVRLAGIDEKGSTDTLRFLPIGKSK